MISLNEFHLGFVLSQSGGIMLSYIGHHLDILQFNHRPQSFTLIPLNSISK